MKTLKFVLLLFLLDFIITDVTIKDSVDVNTIQINPSMLISDIQSKDFSFLIQKGICPGTESFGDCFYPMTPQDRSIYPVVWNCPAGSFCHIPSSSERCTSGFYCPINTGMIILILAQPIYCPAKYFCSEDTISVFRCPQGSYCPSGTITPIKCLFASCPEGTSYIPQSYVLFVFLVFALSVIILFHRKSVYYRKKSLKHIQQINELKYGEPNFGKPSAASITKKPKILNVIESVLPLGTETELNFNIDFENLVYKLPSGKTILDGVSGSLKCGRMCAIMGPSGCGKSTFLSLLKGKIRPNSGIIKINGVSDSLVRYKKLIGFVPQDDIMMTDLTVRDILMHSARTRLPASWSYKKIRRLVSEIIQFLGLTNIISSVIGDLQQRGISGNINIMFFIQVVRKKE
jgi:hypothetical protein